jgi:hypothetical protein
MSDNHLNGLAIKEKNDTRIAIGIHRDGLLNLLAEFGISKELQETIRSGVSHEWVNISIIRRGQKHPAGFTHFAVTDLNRGGQNG